MDCTIEGNTLIIRLPISERSSKSGKTTVIAGTGGFTSTAAQYKGQPVSINVNATIRK